MKVLVVSGFLGAGKTTFIKEMIRKTKKPLVILENEYGETDLDKNDIKDSSQSELNIMEFMEGCVCCSQKDTFANSLITIQASLDPEYLVVEPTGVGKLSNIISNVNRVTWEKIEILKPVVIVSPATYFAMINEYDSICKDQVKNASYIVFSKIENMSDKELAPVVKDILSLNPEATIIDTPYQSMEKDWFDSLLMEENTKEIENSDDNDDIDLDQHTLKLVKIKYPENLIVLLGNCIRGRFGNIPRAKGVVKAGEEWMRFDVAGGMYSITGCQEKEPVAQCVFIGNEIDRDAINKFFVRDIPSKMGLGEKSKALNSDKKFPKIM